MPQNEAVSALMMCLPYGQGSHTKSRTKLHKHTQLIITAHIVGCLPPVMGWWGT
jgi:hypothetical protein